MQLSVTRLPAISTQVAKGIEKGMQDAYKLLPKRVDEFGILLAQKRAASDRLCDILGEDICERIEVLGEADAELENIIY